MRARRRVIGLNSGSDGSGKVLRVWLLGARCIKEGAGVVLVVVVVVTKMLFVVWRDSGSCTLSVDSIVWTVWPLGMATNGGRNVPLRLRCTFRVLPVRECVVVLMDGVRMEAELDALQGTAQPKDMEDLRLGLERMWS